MVAAARLRTERLILDPAKAEDLDEIFEIARDRKSIEDFQSAAERIEDVRAWFDPSLEDPLNLVWIIRKDGRAIGLFDLYFEAEYSQTQGHVCRIGYFVSHREHRKGYATEALAAVAEWVFGETQTTRIEAGVTLRNAASFRVLEKVGFVREKVARGNWAWRGKVYDSAYYCLTKGCSGAPDRNPDSEQRHPRDHRPG
ncbi:GNAT family N-acetyltransferase [Pelagibius sp.]|uniref:GNAT family N-acetyltransferase n=1 Tax=Pelagibius sp. TaxID=1931238 RepID=UPI002636812B|nr:GNAT family N-acetyltransferase [Pelagibius sp.]